MSLVFQLDPEEGETENENQHRTYANESYLRNPKSTNHKVYKTRAKIYCQ